jgi:hypothetical protein
MVAGFFFVPYQQKILSLLFTSGGYVTYVSTTTSHNLFTLSRMYKHSPAKLRNYFEGRLYQPLGIIRQGFHLIAQLPKHQPISLVEILPTYGVQYIRSAGSRGIMIKKDW